MKNYNLGLNVAGTVQFVLAIRDKDLRSAKREWARIIIGFNDPKWDKRRLTYSEWPVVETSEPALQRKMETNYFSY